MADEKRPSERPTVPDGLAAVRFQQTQSGSFRLHADDVERANEALGRHEIAALLRRMTALEERIDRFLARIASRPGEQVADTKETVLLARKDPRLEQDDDE